MSRKQRYMDDDTFDTGVTGILEISLLSGRTIEEIVDELAPKMAECEDDGWRQAWIAGSRNVEALLDRHFDRENAILFLRHLRNWIRHYDRLSGRRKLRLFRGARFQYRSSPNDQRVKDCSSRALAFLTRLMHGTAPLDSHVLIPAARRSASGV